MHRSRLAPALALLLGAAALLGLACGGSSGGGGETGSPSSTTDLPIEYVPARWSTASAQDVASLARAYPIVFIGTIEREAGTRMERAAESAPERATFPITRFDVRVDESIAGGLDGGSTVTLQQPGGPTEISGGERVHMLLNGDAPISVGETYLFFATWESDGAQVLVTAPFSRFAVGGSGQLVAPAPWAALGVAQELAGISTEAAASAVEAVTP